ncbi:type II CRISPR RNA-guided endonuclease Cas9 [Paracoccus sp. S1E-3]|uniref:type II CRISPR RNA-guided endonuclease Cas9 n=1 Tax=Paracoccus sp. S1E-3 TaxID=2756130 RepID=UPI0015EF1151|nr:type II CRISPR RNA-guided endonuclease Cas9 [Paracoccus sp. S1E-3]MBA4491754.1 type II CRISPR RNA-guided endonuclease Cas9 [Paracoccus sp. S1E-3]
MHTRLALDIGTSSIGWILYQITDDRPTRILDGGVRIFGDGREAKTGQSLAVGRRTARGMRRRRDRYLRRRAALMKRLGTAGLMPSDPAQAAALNAIDPYELRALGLDHRLPLPHLGRALFHLNQRRGFKSNRRTDKGDNEGGLIKDATARLDQAMMAAGARSYGEFLHMLRQQAGDARDVPAVRTRINPHLTGEDGKEQPGYDFYPERRHLEEEFHKLWQAQAQHHAALTDELRDSLFETIFYQRPLKTPAVGRCLFLPEPRLPKAHPLTQRRTLYETVNMLRVVTPGEAKRRLTREERDIVIHALDNRKILAGPGKNVMTLAALGKDIKLRPDQSFSLETANRDSIACDPVRMSLGYEGRYGAQWSTLTIEQQWELIQQLREQQDGEALVQWIMDRTGFDRNRARAIADAPLPEGFGRLGETATRRILEVLIGGTADQEVATYNEAVAFCGWDHSRFGKGEALERLPYYGEVLDRHVLPGTGEPDDDPVTRFGRITNPTVHIGLGQVRRLVNLIIDTHGRPDQIVLELARNLKMSEEEKRELAKTNAKNQRAAEANSDDIAILNDTRAAGQPAIVDNGASRAILRIWKESSSDVLNRVCPYTGTQITPAMLFDGSCDIDHILPYSRTLDDSFPNRVVCLKSANREKRNQTPWEAWGNTPKWPVIEANLKNLPGNKAWRFQPDAMTRFEGERNFEARALVDTQYLSRLTREYLESLYADALAAGRRPIWVVAGKLTELLRRHWGLNGLLPDAHRGTSKAKNRQDHRHHMIDAAVVGATDHSMVQRISKMSAANIANGLEALAGTILPPWPGLRDDLKTQLDRTIVSHRADHGRIDAQARKQGRDSTSGQLHNDTAYGLTSETLNGVPLVVSRKPIDSLTPAMLDKIRDSHLAGLLRHAIEGKEGKDLKAAIEAFRGRPGPYHRIRHLRLIEPVDVIKIRDRNGKAYKGYKGDSNQCYEVWRLPDGRLTHHVVSTFDAHQGGESRPHPAAKRLIRLFKDDMVKLDDSKFGPVIATVRKFDVNGGLSLVAHNESNADQRYRKDKEDVFIRMQPSALIRAGARRVVVDEMGRFRDPGRPPDRIR